MQSLNPSTEQKSNRRLAEEIDVMATDLSDGARRRWRVAKAGTQETGTRFRRKKEWN